MRRTALLAALLFIFSGAATAVVGHETPEGQMGIMSSGSSGASKAVGPNGTLWSAEVSMANRSRTDINDSVFNVSYTDNGEKKARFSGRIAAPTPCHVIEHEVKETGNNSYVMNVKTVRDKLDGERPCTQVITGIEYDTSFQTEETFNLEIQHNGDKVRTLEYPEEQREPHSDPGRNTPLVNGILDLVSGIF